MKACSLSDLIETLVQSIALDAVAIRECALMRQSMQARGRQSEAGRGALSGRDGLRMAGRRGRGEQGPQQACRQKCCAGVDHPVAYCTDAVREEALDELIDCAHRQRA